MNYYVVKLVCNGVIAHAHVQAVDKPTAKQYARDHYRKEHSISTQTKLGATVVFESADPAESSAYIQNLEQT